MSALALDLPPSHPVVLHPAHVPVPAAQIFLDKLNIFTYLMFLSTCSGVGILVTGAAEEEVVAVVVQGHAVHLVVDIPGERGVIIARRL